MIGGHLLHGGDYNPEQWIEYPEILEEDLKLMNKANVNCVTLGVFSWAELEPKEDVYTFEWLEEIIDKLRERKIQSETDFTTRQHHSGDGFVRSDNVFGGVKQVVLDEVFKGAEIRNSFGGTVLDLRRTNIEQGETYIDVECNFGGVEIYVPLDWRVDLQANAFLGGCEDKRVPGVNIDQSRRLVVIGNVSFGGVEIKG